MLNLILSAMKTLNALIGKSLKYSATAVALIISAVLTAQEVDYNLVNGVIKDAKTKERVVFATISVPGTTIEQLPMPMANYP